MLNKVVTVSSGKLLLYVSLFILAGFGLGLDAANVWGLGLSRIGFTLFSFCNVSIFILLIFWPMYKRKK